MNKENQLSLLETKDMTIVNLDELANILGGASSQAGESDEKKKDKTKSQDSGHAGGLVCWC